MDFTILDFAPTLAQLHACLIGVIRYDKRVTYSRIPIKIQLETFEGPLDLLLYLIQSHELDISKISLEKITDQYLAYIQIMQELNFDVASEFLVMAATLIKWKSKAILPVDPNSVAIEADSDEDDEITQEDLIRQILEHKRFLAAGDQLADIPRLNEDVFTRKNPKQAVERVWREMNINDLALSYQETLVHSRKKRKVLRKETVSLTQKLLDFKDRLEPGKVTPLYDLIPRNPDRPEIVVVFLASLELCRLKKMRIFQQETYSPIYVELLESLANFNFELATGFDEPPPQLEAL